MSRSKGKKRPAKLGLFFLFASIFLLLSSFSILAGCGPKYTYPADTVPEAIENICRNENNLVVSARVVGKTVGAMITIEDLLDDKGQIPKQVHEKMGQIMQAVTRVALSTDRAIDFCVVIIRDRVHKNELIVTRSLDDTKRANSDAIGVEESINRTLFGQGKYQSTPAGENIFVLKEVKLANFLADQIAQRIRLDFVKDAKEESSQPFVLVDGLYDSSPESRRFRFSILSLKSEEPNEVMLMVFHKVNDVLEGYRFTDFTEIEILDYLNRQKLTVDRQTLLNYQAKQISDQAILDRYLTESQSVQEAFKLFGFNLSDASTDAAEVLPIASATP